MGRKEKNKRNGKRKKLHGKKLDGREKIRKKRKKWMYEKGKKGEKKGGKGEEANHFFPPSSFHYQGKKGEGIIKEKDAKKEKRETKEREKGK